MPADQMFWFQRFQAVPSTLTLAKGTALFKCTHAFKVNNSGPHHMLRGSIP